MVRPAPWFVGVLTAVAIFASAPTASALLADDAIPLPGSPVELPMDATAPVPSAFYTVDLVEGETLHLSLTMKPESSTSNFDLDLYFYGPATATADHALAVAKSTGAVTMYPETISYTAGATTTYFIEVHAKEGSGVSSLAWSIAPEPLLPVYRFYNVRTGTHFYTPDEAEKATVQSTMASTYRFEGVAYSTKATKNTQPLFRFYNRRNGSHFYTASVTERDHVYANLSGTYSYDGPTYKVSPESAAGKSAVYRFFNTKTGSHFYTADLTERDRVITTLGYMYTYEGEAFWLGQ